jgi:hypothetical protein
MPSKPVKSLPTVKVAGKTLADFRAAHDKGVIIPARLKKALEKMAAVSWDAWDYEQDYLRAANVAPQDCTPFREQFIEHIVETGGKNPKRVWFATAKAAKAARGE